MATVGERLRLLRESGETTIDEMAQATGIGRSYLEALERDEIHELPGKAFGKLYIRAYAEVLEFDPQPWIEDYDREQLLVAGASIDATSTAPAGSRPVAAAIAQWKATRTAATRPAVETVEDADDVEALEAVDDAESIDAADAASPLEPEPTPIREAQIAPHAVRAPAAAQVTAPKRRLAPVVGIVIAVTAVAIYLGTRPTDTPKDPPRPTASPPPEIRPPAVALQTATPSPAPASPEPAPPVAATPPRAKPETKPSSAGEEPARTLSVTEFGVGRRVVGSRLEGETDLFAVGERAAFMTRVIGGRRGELVRHVWMRDGRVEQSIPLRLGAQDFRTHSNKTLGRPGAWAVEARDPHGVVLARVEFGCGP